MENFEKILRSKKEIYLKYQSSLIDVGDIKFQRDDFSKDSNYWLFTFRTKKMWKLLNHLNEKGIQSRPFFGLQ